MTRKTDASNVNDLAFDGKTIGDPAATPALALCLAALKAREVKP